MVTRSTTLRLKSCGFAILFGVGVLGAAACRSSSESVEGAGGDDAAPEAAIEGGLDVEVGDASADGLDAAGPFIAAPPLIAAGQDYACAIATSGELRCWGGGSGDPVVVDAGSRFIDVAAATNESLLNASTSAPSACAIRSDGALVCWGATTSTAYVLDTRAFIKVAIGPTAGPCAIAQTGVLYCWTGDPLMPAQIGSDTDWVYLSAASGGACAIKKSGALWCWGMNLPDVQDGGPVPMSPVEVKPGKQYSDVATAAAATCAVGEDAALDWWGYAIGSSMLGWVRIALDRYRTCGVTWKGALVCIGDSGLSRVGTDADWSSIALGQNDTFACARKADGTAWCWGSNANGQLGVGDGAPASDLPVLVH